MKAANEFCIILTVATLLQPCNSFAVFRHSGNEVCEEDKLPPCEGEHSDIPPTSTIKHPETATKSNSGLGEKGTFDHGDFPFSFLDAFIQTKRENDRESIESRDETAKHHNEFQYGSVKNDVDYHQQDETQGEQWGNVKEKQHFQVFEDYLQLYNQLLSQPTSQSYNSPQLFLTARRARRSFTNNLRKNNQYYVEGAQNNRELPQHQGKSAIKKLLTDMLHRLETIESEGTLDYESEARARDHRIRNHGSDHIHEHNYKGFPPIPRQQAEAIPNVNKCSLHGLWLSAVTGVAFQIEPNLSTGFGLKVQVLDSGHPAIIKTPHGEENKVITSDWLGSALVSPERSTTISIVLQEKINNPVSGDGSIIEPKTAVFVGQCLICSGTPTIQGSWIIFPEAQTCFRENERPPKADNLYLLRAVN